MPWMRTLAAPSEGEVACARRPPISFSIMTMSPGVIISFSSISSRSSTSTRIGSSSIPRPVRVAATVMCSSSAVCAVSSIGIARCSPAATVSDTLAGSKPSLTTTITTGPGGTSTASMPAVSAGDVVPLTTTDAAGTALPPLRTSIRSEACCTVAFNCGLS